jgi:APA family basic amino acid/polyamine antiporter
LIALVAGSRMARSLAREGDLPKVVAAVRGRHGTPWAAAILLGAVALALLPVGGVSAVASLSSFAALLAFVVVNAAVVVLRFRRPRADRPFRVPLAVGRFPVLPALALASALLLLSHFDVATYVGGAVALAATLLAHGVRALVTRASRRRPA